MKILLVTLTDKLAEKLAALSPEIEYCAIVVDAIEPAKEILKGFGLSTDLLRPMNKLQKFVETLEYDYVLCVQTKAYGLRRIRKLKSYGLPTDKLVSFAALPTTKNWHTERHIRYYREHAQDFEMFATGTSTAETAIDIRKFKHKAINLATSSQDLYYNFQIAKNLVLYGGGHGKLRYALIGLAPYSFHFDLSKTYRFKARLLPYFIAFNDIHNFPIPIDVYKQLLHAKWLAQNPSIEKVNLNGVKKQNIISQEVILEGGTNNWIGKSYPETRDENIKILDDYLTLCEENNIRPIMFRAPVSEKYMANFNPQLLEEFDVLVEQALSKHSSAVFIDGWKLNLVTYADFYDHGHLNVYGAAKFSEYLNNFIEESEAKER